VAIDEIMVRRDFGTSGDVVVIEECLVGEETSILAIVDGKTIVPLETSQDHKRAYDGDEGPNTGGMGAYSPAPLVTPELMDRIIEKILVPAIHAMHVDKRPFCGILYAGLMIDAQGQPWMLEYNCRFGDPETQPVLARLQGDLGAWLAGAAAGALPGGAMTWDPRPAVCVVLASAGYPEQPRTGDRIAGLDRDFGDDVMVFHAGTSYRDNHLLTAGGRVLGVTALAADLAAARARAYDAVARISFDGMQFRRDIGARGIGGNIA